MYALSPPLFQLLTATALSPCNQALASSAPAVQHALLSALHSHCARHDSFIASSGLFTTSAALLSHAPTRDHFRSLVDLLASVLGSAPPADTTLLALAWLDEIADLISPEYVSLFETPLFSQLIGSLVSTAYSTEPCVCLLACRLLTKLLRKFGRLSLPLLHRLRHLATYYTHSLDSATRAAYTPLLATLPLNVLSSSRHPDTTTTDSRQLLDVARTAYLQNSGSELALTITSFKTIMGYVLAGLSQSSDLYAATWLERLFFASRTAASGHLETAMDGHEGLLWLWALWETAQFCVQSRLKTPIGKAQDTFVAIETAIKACSSQLAQAREEPLSLEGVSQALGRVSLLVHFVELLEKLVYNAHEGTAVSLQPAPKQVKVFFRTNKSTCSEWFWRVRLHLVRICARTGLHELTVRQAQEFAEYSVAHGLEMAAEFEQVVAWWVEALVKVRAWQSLEGVQRWLAVVSPKRSYAWIGAAALEAQGR